MPTASNSKLPISGSITIEIPKKMLRMDKHDHIKLINTLTPSKGIAGGNTKTVKMIPVSGDKTKIISQGISKPSDKKSRDALAEKINTAMDKVEMKLKANKNKK
jgi:hypothetical protein